MFRLEVSGLDEAIQRFQRAERLDKRSLTQVMGQIMVRQLRERIAKEKRAPSGRAWAPLKPSTVARKGNSNIMIHSGKLLGSAAFSADSGQAMVGLNVPYATFHHTGTRKMVARPAVGLSRQNESELERACMSFVQRQMGF